MVFLLQGHQIHPYLPIAYCEILSRLYSTRYLQPRMRMPFSTILRDQVLPQYAPDKFRNIIRLTPNQFDALLVLIQDNHVFQSQDPTRPQAPVRTQLLVTLYRLGTKGLSTYKCAFTMGVGHGTVDLYTWRCIRAIEDLEDQYIVWPDNERKAKISKWFKSDKGFPNAIGAVDGVPFPFESAPSYDTISWNTRKFVYAMGCTAVCDHQGRFTFVSTGYVGSMNDSLAYRATRLHKDRDEFFQGKEYLLADAGYSITSTVIPRYKGTDITPQEHRFNGLHGSARVKIEHAFGWLKLKWQSLQNLPVKIDKKRHIGRASSWVIACMILHNFCLVHPDGGETDDAEENWNQRALHAPPRHEEEVPLVEVDDWNENDERARGKARRRKLKKWVLKNHRNVGRYRL